MELGERIKTLRKQRQLRQEELAEAMGVSTASVSKWETGQCAPELTVLMELADYFEVSVDTLMGHCLKEDRIQNLLLQLEEAESSGDEAGMVSLGEKLLRNYPNQERVVEACARAYYRLFIQTGTNGYLESCIHQTKRLMTICKGEDETARLARLRSLGNQYELLKQWDRAKEYYEQSNIDGNNDACIAACLLQQGQAQDAVVLLSKDLSQGVFRLFHTVSKLADAWVALGEHEKACAALVWENPVLESLPVNRTMLLILRLQLAEIYAAAGKTEAAKSAFRSAAELLQQKHPQPGSAEASFLQFKKAPELVRSDASDQDILRQSAEGLGEACVEIVQEVLPLG